MKKLEFNGLQLLTIEQQMNVTGGGFLDVIIDKAKNATDGLVDVVDTSEHTLSHDLGNVVKDFSRWGRNTTTGLL
ncbi:hypothetical protein [Chitinophaga nivalis]|uniref:Bacteriocin n=1 Tax=Chitinophaga nivalis TaxID=2991709 RepID=A0ABT3IWA4_9BACT|nr:hypothetical protein [Chitinophaga nivalis]MCW3462054.1 hypothetical protein [Chitinophaga nivalis]MCW3488254.1 hypothetical protein [Chitinophaga nivalis]